MADERIELLRRKLQQRAKKVSINKIAKDAGVNQPIVHRFWSGDQDSLHADTAIKLARYLKVRLS